MDESIEVVELGEAEDLIEQGLPVGSLEVDLVYTQPLYPFYAE